MPSRQFNRFPDSSMMSLTSEKVRYDLAESVGPDLTLAQALGEVSITSLADVSLEYGTAQGSQALRRLIAAQHDVNDADVITTVGGMHAIFLCGTILCNPGDHVLIQQPGFPLTQSALAFNNATIETLPCQFDTSYRVDIDTLTERLKPKTSLVCIASPQNPSGVAIPDKMIADILAAMTAHSPNAFLLLDETYRRADYGSADYLRSPVNTDQRIISTASLSKCHGTPGLRLGWVITRHNELRTQLLNGKFQTVISCSGIDEAVATHVLAQEEKLMPVRRKHLRECRDAVGHWVSIHPDLLEWVQPDAGALCCVRLNPQRFKSHHIERFHTGLSRRSLRVAPGQWFDDEEHVFRLGFGLLPAEQLHHGLEIMSDALKNLH